MCVCVPIRLLAGSSCTKTHGHSTNWPHGVAQNIVWESSERDKFSFQQSGNLLLHSSEDLPVRDLAAKSLRRKVYELSVPLPVGSAIVQNLRLAISETAAPHQGII